MKLARYNDGSGVVIGSVQGDTIVPWLRAQTDGQEEILALAMDREPLKPIGEPKSLTDVALEVPVPNPPSVRDFLTYERHFETMMQDAQGNLPEAWYDGPAFYFTSPHDLIADAGTVVPPETHALDYELEIAVVVGKEGCDLTPEEAVEHIAGYTLFNDFSARDIQARELTIGLGPSKCKDFGGGLGPFLVTPDELPGQPGRPGGFARAQVNGRLCSEGEISDMRFDFAQMIAHASSSSRVRAGDVLGSGTVATGCIAELSKTHGESAFPWLQAGDLVELSHNVLGTLRTTVGGR